MDPVAVFDAGSTNLRYAVADPSGEFLTDIHSEATRAEDLSTQLQSAIATLRDALGDEPNAVAVSTTGLVDAEAPVVRSFDTSAGETIAELDFGAMVDGVLDVPVYVENDCNAAALGEWHYGAENDHDTLVSLMIATGIGGGIVEDGHLLRGESGQAGEFGLLPVAPDDLESTGVRGAWEAYCAGRGIPVFARTLGAETGLETTLSLDESLTAQDVFQAAAGEDPLATECLDRVARYNGAGVAAVCNAVNPGLVTIDGGVARNNPDEILDGIDRHLEDYLFVDRPTIRISSLGDDAGLYGALATYVDRTMVRDAR